MEESILRLDLDLLILLFAEGGDANAIGYHVFRHLAGETVGFYVRSSKWRIYLGIEDPIDVVPPVLEILLENGLDPNRHLGDQQDFFMLIIFDRRSFF